MLTTTNEAPLVLLVAPEGAPDISPALTEAGFRMVRSNQAHELLASLEKIQGQAVVIDARIFPRGSSEIGEFFREISVANHLPILMLVDSINPTIEGLSNTYSFDLVSDERFLAYHLRRALQARKSREERRRSETRFSRARRMAGFASWEWSLETNTFQCDPELLDIFGIPARRNRPHIEDLLDRVRPADRARVRTAFESRRPHQIEYRLISDPTHPRRAVQQDAELIQDEPNGEVRLLGTVLDISDLKEAQKKIAHLVYFDSLTGLPNRAYLTQHLGRAIHAARQTGERLAVMGLDLDLFKRVNDTLGHAAGDMLLKEVARRISSAIRHGDSFVSSGQSTIDIHSGEVGEGPDGSNTAVRLGGDEFIILLNRLKAAEDAAAVARRISEKVSKSVLIEGTEVFVSCSIGIALFPDNSDNSDELLKQADAAMYEAKEKGRNTYQYFSESIHERALRRVKIENGLRSVLAKDELKVFYQPKVDIRTGKTLGAEALLRWVSLDERISPAEFIPVAEDTSLILPIGEWVFRSVCRQVKDWLSAGQPLSVAVNVSPRQFREADFVETVANILKETGVPANLIELEITESSIMQTSEHGAKTIQRLKELGVSIALDDFGTGYSSLSYLSRLPIDTLKIDVSFVSNVITSESCRAITSAIIALASTLKLNVVAEGVETGPQIAFLLQHGCSVAQGFAFSPAVPSVELLPNYPLPEKEDDGGC